MSTKKRIIIEYIPHMEAYRMYYSDTPNKTIAYLDDTESDFREAREFAKIADCDLVIISEED